MWFELEKIRWEKECAKVSSFHRDKIAQFSMGTKEIKSFQLKVNYNCVSLSAFPFFFFFFLVLKAKMVWSPLCRVISAGFEQKPHHRKSERVWNYEIFCWPKPNWIRMNNARKTDTANKMLSKKKETENGDREIERESDTKQKTQHATMN